MGSILQESCKNFNSAKALGVYSALLETHFGVT